MSEKIYPPLVMPDTVERETVTVWSAGLALDADIYRPKDMTAASRVPAIALCHGWGGSKLTAERYAGLFAQGGMVALTFSQASWFGSDPIVQLGQPIESQDAPADATASVRFIRELVDPIDWIRHLRAAVDYLEGEPGVDPGRIGLWGTSFGGGVATQLAAEDERVRALVIQVPALAPLPPPARAHARRRAIEMARGTVDSLPQGLDAIPDLRGTPHMGRLAQYDALSHVGRLTAPVMILDAENDEMFSIADNGARAHDVLRSRPGVVDHYEVIPGIDHYGIYFDGFTRSSIAARDWFVRHL